MYGVRRFDDIQRWLGVGRNILTQRLGVLVEEGFLVKQRYQTSPDRFEYVLTEKGRDATTVLIALLEFGEKWHFAAGDEPIRLYDAETDRRVHAKVVDAETGKSIDTRKLYPGPGPGFRHDEDVQRRRFVEFGKRGRFD